MSSTQARNALDDLDLLLYDSDFEYDFDDSLETISLTDADIRDILTLPPTTDESTARDTDVVMEQERPPSPDQTRQPEVIQPIATIPRSPTPSTSTATVQPCEPQASPQKLYLATIIKPPSLMEVKMFCRQEVIMLSGLLYLGSLTLPYLPGCLQTSHIWDDIIGQTMNHLKKLKPFNKIHPFYRLVIDHPIFTFLTQDGTPYSLTKKHLTSKRNPSVPRPLYTVNENLVVTLTFTMDIAPFGSTTSADMFGPAKAKLPITQRLGPKRPRTPDSSAPGHPVHVTCEPEMKKRRHFFTTKRQS